MSGRHTPVFADAVIKLLEPATGKRFIDATVGEGGHLRLLVSHEAKVLGLDYDERQVERLQSQLDPEQATVVHANFAEIARIAPQYGFSHVNGILADLGLSMSQLREAGKGLSFRQPSEQLSMRIVGKGPTAADILTEYAESELREMLITNSEEPCAGEIARAVVLARRSKQLTVVADLLEILDEVAERVDQKRPEQLYARVFQALRMEVNEEIPNLQKFLETAAPLLIPGGRLVIITFHSLEDRIVKRWGTKQSDLKPIKVSIQKKHRRSFERSAQLRVFEKHL